MWVRSMTDRIDTDLMRGVDVEVRHLTFGPFRGGIYSIVIMKWMSGEKRRRAEVTVSPTGRSVMVYVDGKQWHPEEGNE